VDGTSCEVAVENAVVRGTPVRVAEAGATSTLSLRPERVLVGPEAEALPNRFDARVEELIYHGDHIRTRLMLLGHDDFIVKVPNRVGHVAMRPGDTVRVGWRVEDCRALDAPRA
jgi:putative spermidine/putrescine transport system ATP-binding protein